jgi:hypothetical protein
MMEMEIERAVHKAGSSGENWLKVAVLGYLILDAPTKASGVNPCLWTCL